jgi:hypothetical protein
MAQSIRIKRRIGGAAGAPGALVIGELGFNDTGNTLDIGTGLDIGPGPNSDVRRLVGADRQVELTGAQDIAGVKTIIAGGGITTPVASLRVTGAPAANSYLRAAAGFATGDLEFGTLPAGGLLAVSVEPPITGDGTAGDPLEIEMADNTAVDGGTDTVFPINSAQLRRLTGNVASLSTSATTIVGAINELNTMIAAMTGAIFLVGTWDADADDITPGLNSPAAAGALPAAAAGNQGWYLIVDTAGTVAAGAEAPAGNYAVGDWLLSNGVAWLHFAMNLGVIAAINITYAPTAPMISVNVQTAIDELVTMITAAANNIHVDGTSITGVTAQAGAGTTSANALRVDIVDGGTF